MREEGEEEGEEKEDEEQEETEQVNDFTMAIKLTGHQRGAVCLLLTTTGESFTTTEPDERGRERRLSLLD